MQIRIIYTFKQMEDRSENPIVERLKQFIQYTGLSSTQFADRAMIPRPTLSQMLHGRNKSVNNQMLTKLNENFPMLDIMWLLFGRGNMLVNANSETSEPQKPADSLFDVQQVSDNQSENSAVTPKYSAPEEDQSNEKTASQSTQAREPVWRASVLCTPPDQEASPRIDASVKAADQGKRITSIIVLYSDNSFETFNPA